MGLLNRWQLRVRSLEESRRSYSRHIGLKRVVCGVCSSGRVLGVLGKGR